jgi:hypothetical protein
LESLSSEMEILMVTLKCRKTVLTVSENSHLAQLEL